MNEVVNGEREKKRRNSSVCFTVVRRQIEHAQLTFRRISFKNQISTYKCIHNLCSSEFRGSSNYTHRTQYVSTELSNVRFTGRTKWSQWILQYLYFKYIL